MRVSDDLEMADFRPKEDDDPFASRSHPIGGRHGHNRLRRGNDLGFGNRSYGDTVRGWIDSFRRDPGRHVTPAAAITSEDPRQRHRHGHGYGHGTGHGHHEHRHRASSSVATADASGVGMGTGVLNGLDESKPSSSFSSSSAGGRAGRSRGGRGGTSHYFDLHAANVGTANTLLSRELKSRHLQMIAIGGSIGTGLFVASGKALHTGGPGAVLIAYLFIGCMLYCTVQALGELAVTFPVAGSFSAYSTRFLDPAWGFTMGWNYALQWLMVLPLEIIAASITVGYWNSEISRAIFITVFLFIILVINLFGVKGYGEAEFVFAIVKITAVIGFVLLGIVINIGGYPNDGYIGGRYWQSPGAFNNGFKGLCAVFVTAAFAFTGTELVGLAAAETANPRRSLPTAIKQVFWRITLFYIVSLTLIGLLVPYNHPRLLGAKSAADASASPFVIAIESAGISVLPAVMNSVILIAVLSVGNSAVFGSSRTLAALADQRQAPSILGYVDRRGRPLVAILVASAFGLLGYLADLDSQSDVLNWLLAVSGLSSVFTWGSICLAHIRFRRAWRAKGRSLRELAFRSQVGVAGSWVGLVLNILVLVAQFWTAAWPVPLPAASSSTKGNTLGMNEKNPTLPTWPSAATTAAAAFLLHPHNTATTDASLGGGQSSGGAAVVPIDSPRDVAQNFFLQYLCAPIVLVVYLGYKFWFRTKVVRIDDMDVDTGRRELGNLPILVSREVDEMKGMPRWKKVYKFLC